MKVCKLDHELSKVYLAKLVFLDQELRSDLGEIYSHHEWWQENFLAERPSKWALSQMVFDEDEILCGFWIASQWGNDCHTHRVAVGKGQRSKGIGEAMFKAVLRASEALSLDRMILSVSSHNLRAHAFYERLGFRRALEKVLVEFVQERDREAQVRGNELVEPGGYPYFLYWRPI